MGKLSKTPTVKTLPQSYQTSDPFGDMHTGSKPNTSFAGNVEHAHQTNSDITKSYKPLGKFVKG